MRLGRSGDASLVAPERSEPTPDVYRQGMGKPSKGTPADKRLVSHKKKGTTSAKPKK
jgi:hypothetical protein